MDGVVNENHQNKQGGKMQVMEPSNKTRSIEIEDFKKKLIDALYDEELKLWHASEPSEAGFNLGIYRAIEVVKEL